MRPRTAVLALLAIICAVLAAGAAVAAAHASAKPPWKTCKPGTKDYLGAYRVVDNAWAGPSSKHFCVSSTGLNIAIRSNAIASGSNVVAYPDVRFGAFFTDGDPQSGLPVRVTRIGQMTLHVKSNCKASGTYLTDADIWYRPRAVWTQHGTFEMVIANCWQGFGQPGGGTVIMPDMSCLPVRCGPIAVHAPVHVGHVAYRWSEWMTRDPVTGLTWPILVFRQVHQTATARIQVRAFVWFARHHGFFHMPRSWWLGSVGYGSELWSGGRGLADSMHLTGTPATG